jgi:hypothetical protein
MGVLEAHGRQNLDAVRSASLTTTGNLQKRFSKMMSSRRKTIANKTVATFQSQQRAVRLEYAKDSSLKVYNERG